VASRSLLLVVSLFVATWAHRGPLQVWDRWDSIWFLRIAEHGYQWSLHGKPATAFFPLYPLLIRAGTLCGVPALAVAIIISNLAFAGVLFYLYRLNAPRLGRRAVRISLWIVALFPTAVFTAAPYSESLFLLCAVLSLTAAEARHGPLSGTWTAVAIATRSVGVALIPALLLAVGLRHVRSWIVAGMLVAAVAAGYGMYLVQHSISLTAPLHAQIAWHRSLTFPWTGFVASLTWLIQQGPDHLPWAVENLLGMVVTVGFLGITVRAWRDLSSPSRAYCFAMWMMLLCTPEWRDGYYAPFSSMDRFVLALFPLAGWAATRLESSRLRATLAVQAALLLCATGVHLSGGWVG
jgi:hypothetical protein